MSAVVFVGPSIHGSRLGHVPDIEVRPPAACGDLLRAAREGATTIGLIDGVFEGQASVWHKEILLALTQGVRILGAASMGALRAAECHDFGMEGVGRIFEAYKSGLRTADSDVAVLHAPAELCYLPLTIALVDAQATITGLSSRGIIHAKEVGMLSSQAAQLHFKERTWQRICSCLSAARQAAMLHAIQNFAVSQKRMDAEELLARIGGPMATTITSEFTRQDLSHTVFLDALEARLSSWVN
jgi:hypothetical protein